MTGAGRADENWHPILTEIWSALGFDASSVERVTVTGCDALPSCYPVTDLAVASIGTACLALSELVGLTKKAPNVSVDRRRSSLWFGWSIAPQGWEMPSPWDPIAGDYLAADGWIKLHTNAPHHRDAALAVLECTSTPEAVAAAVATWSADALEAAIVGAGGCAAAMRSHQAWLAHPQGIAVSAEPLIASVPTGSGQAESDRRARGRPLAGGRVLDLTRVLAGPVATRFLAGYGAEVLRIDPLDWDEPGVVPEVTLGKQCARLNLTETSDRTRFKALLTRADVVVHGYRSGALDARGYSAEALQTIRPGIINVSLNAYGHSGPWSTRRGFDSLVQMSAGIADAGMIWTSADRPTPLPVQALDHATGYLMAAAVIQGIYAREMGRATRARLSLARTAKLLMDHKAEPNNGNFVPRQGTDLSDLEELTSWGAARRVLPPAEVAGFPMSWDSPATALGSAAAEWRV
jgi:CoA-transferase family III